jgi:hypothetical protein
MQDSHKHVTANQLEEEMQNSEVLAHCVSCSVCMVILALYYKIRAVHESCKHEIEKLKWLH